jgi:WD40 repeat protein
LPAAWCRGHPPAGKVITDNDERRPLPAESGPTAKKAPVRAKTPPGLVRQLELKHKGRVTALAFSPRGRVIASASQDRSVKLAQAETGKVIKVRPPGEFDFAFVAAGVSPDGHTVASVGQGRRRSRQY